jgi:hypothetical protein
VRWEPTPKFGCRNSRPKLADTDLTQLSLLLYSSTEIARVQPRGTPLGTSDSGASGGHAPWAAAQSEAQIIRFGFELTALDRKISNTAAGR